MTMHEPATRIREWAYGAAATLGRTIRNRLLSRFRDPYGTPLVAFAGDRESRTAGGEAAASEPAESEPAESEASPVEDSEPGRDPEPVVGE